MPQAHAAPAAQGSDLLLSLLPFVLIFAVIYFLMIRPQQKRMAAHKKALSEMKRGDRVVTNSGIVGTITKVKPTEFILEVAEGVQILVVKEAIASLYAPSSAPQPQETADKSPDSSKSKKAKAPSTKTKK